MLLIRTTRSFESHVSYCAGMDFAAPFADRARFDDAPERTLDVDDDDELADVTEAFPRGSTFVDGGALSLADNWGSSGSGGT